MKDEKAIDWKEGFPQTFIEQIKQAEGKVMGSFWFFGKFSLILLGRGH